MFQNNVTQHISAMSLRSLDTPKLPHIVKLSNHDNNFRKSDYYKDFYGLQDLPYWNVINNYEYKNYVQ